MGQSTEKQRREIQVGSCNLLFDLIDPDAGTTRVIIDHRFYGHIKWEQVDEFAADYRRLLEKWFGESNYM